MLIKNTIQLELFSHYKEQMNRQYGMHTNRRKATINRDMTSAGAHKLDSV